MRCGKCGHDGEELKAERDALREQIEQDATAVTLASGEQVSTAEGRRLALLLAKELKAKVVELESQVKHERDAFKRILHSDSEKTFVGLFVESDQENEVLRKQIGVLMADAARYQALKAALLGEWFRIADLPELNLIELQAFQHSEEPLLGIWNTHGTLDKLADALIDAAQKAEKS